MKNLSKVTVFIFLIVLGLMVFILQWKGPSRQKYLLHFNPGQITHIHLKNEQGEFQFQNSEETWYLTAPSRRKAYQKMVGQIIARALTLEPTRSVGEAVDESSSDVHGFKTPRIVLNLEDQTGHKWGVLFGKESPVGQFIYLKVEGSPQIYLIPNSVFTYLNQGLLEWIERRWVQVPPFEEIKKIDISLLGDAWAVVRSPQGWAIQNRQGSAPFDEEKVKTLLNLMKDVSVTKLIPFSPGMLSQEMFRYDPDLTIRINDAEYHFWFYNSQVFTQSADSPDAAIKFHTESVGPFLRSLAEIRNFPPLNWW